jgi:hypothetical protein
MRDEVRSSSGLNSSNEVAKSVHQVFGMAAPVLAFILHIIAVLLKLSSKLQEIHYRI